MIMDALMMVYKMDDMYLYIYITDALMDDNG